MEGREGGGEGRKERKREGEGEKEEIQRVRGGGSGREREGAGGRECWWQGQRGNGGRESMRARGGARRERGRETGRKPAAFHVKLIRRSLVPCQSLTSVSVK